jgi:ribosomal protein L15
LAKANPAATEKLPVAAARARPRAAAVPSVSVSKAARCRSSAASQSAVLTTHVLQPDIIGVNVGDLNKFDDGAKVDETALALVGLAKGRSDGVKILGNGELSKKLSVTASAFSASAKAKIEAKGGTCEIISRKPAAAVKA